MQLCISPHHICERRKKDKVSTPTANAALLKGTYIPPDSHSGAPKWKPDIAKHAKSRDTVFSCNEHY